MIIKFYKIKTAHDVHYEVHVKIDGSIGVSSFLPETYNKNPDVLREAIGYAIHNAARSLFKKIPAISDINKIFDDIPDGMSQEAYVLPDGVFK